MGLGTATYTWDDELNQVFLTNVGTPSTVTWATLRSRDRAAVKAHKLHPRTYEWEISEPPTPKSITPELQVRPLDNIALQLTIDVQDFVAEGVLTVMGTDWLGSALSEDVLITGDGEYQTTNRFRTISNISDDGTLKCKWRLWQSTGWGIWGYNPSVPALTTDYILQGGIDVGNGITFTPVVSISQSYRLTPRVHTGDRDYYLSPYFYDITVQTGGTCLLGNLYDLTTKTVGLGVQIDISGGTLAQIANIGNLGGIVGLYGTSGTRLTIHSLASATTRVWGTQLSSVSKLMGAGYDVFNVLGNKLTYFLDCSLFPFGGTVDRVTLFGTLTIVLTHPALVGDLTLSNIYSRGHTYVLYQHSATECNVNIYFINPDFDSWNFDWGGFMGKVWRQPQFDAYIEDENGDPLSDVTAVGKYADGSEAFSAVTSDVNGNILTQLITRSWYEKATGNTENLKTPLYVTYSKAGYQTQIKIYPMAKKTEDTVKMQKGVDVIFVDGKPALNLSEQDPKNELYTML